MEETEIGALLSAATEASGLAPRAAQTALSQGQSVGRYVIVSTLGAGGMGVVYKAYDPELDRRVAIKVLRPPLHGRSRAKTGRGRLIREAQALAQLQHPNVITVHDVGEHEDRVFIAMEYIDGITLREWSKANRRSWREVIDVLTAAGRGLQAAHAKQLVHRDFKPDNVMLAGESPTQSGRVLVLDFGLAAGPTRLVSPAAIGPDCPGASGTATLTATGAVLGTPAYMAPEQYAAKPSDPRTDQFNFCVTLFETLYGERPFAGDSRAALVAACTSATIRPAPSSTLVPPWIRAVVVRGLAAAPEQRWPSMEVLLAELARDPTRSRRLRAVLGLGVLAVGLAAGGSVFADRNRLAACRQTADRMDAVWNDEVRTRVHTAITSSGAGYGQSTWERLGPLLDERAAAWREHRYAACVEVKELPSSLRAVQRDCFDESIAALTDQIEVLGNADRDVVSRAIMVAHGPAKVSVCNDPRSLARRPAPPRDAAARERALRLRRRLGRARTLDYAGRSHEAMGLVDAVLAEARESDTPQLVAAVLHTRGRLLRGQGRLREAESDLEDAFFIARAIGADTRAAEIARRLSGLLGYALTDKDAGSRWARHAALLAEAADLGELERAYLDQTRAHTALAAGNYQAALTGLEHVREVLEREVGVHSREMHAVLRGMAMAYERLGQSERAVAAFERSLEAARELYGEHHPETAYSHNNLAVAYIAVGAYESAELHVRRALEIHDGLGPDGAVGTALNNLALILRETGRAEEAVDTSSRAVRVLRGTAGEHHVSTADALTNRGQALRNLGRPEDAIVDITRALEIYEAKLGPDHKRIGDAVYTLAVLIATGGEHERALALHLRGLRIRQASLPAEHPAIGWSALGVAVEAHILGDAASILEHCEPLAKTLADSAGLPVNMRAGLLTLSSWAMVESGRTKQALSLATLAVALDNDPAQPDPNRHASDFALGRALWETGQDKAGGLELARAARIQGEQDGTWTALDIKRAEQWLVGKSAVALR